MLRESIDKLLNKEDLSELEMTNAMNNIMEGKESPIMLSSFLTALKMKGETSSEITGAAKVMREKAENVEIDDIYAVDTCGTGGDKSGTYNISTASAFITAAAKIPVVKHGNRSATSKCGSADVLEAFGVKLDLTPDQVKKCVLEQNIGFFFAPAFHKAMKHAIGVRKELGIRTIFNILGPLTNPAKPKGQILGVFDPELTEVMAEVLKNLGVESALVVHGMDGLDEFTITAETRVSEIKNGKINTYNLDPVEQGLSLAEKENLTGGDSKENSEIILNLFNGEKGPKRDILLLNSGASIYVGQKADSIKEGIKIAEEIIDSGKALEKLQSFIKFTNSF